ncbi:hypothetical protein QVD17_19971 [Tagetes erecta]|uniref:Uncharacterized protein n=1 Tax=Tagetes erecta TaxID=13708 RepID=A0AAD8NWY3_TARER|nr:hypothetical protein QVD17_19971 [Tagetes erecta]
MMKLFDAHCHLQDPRIYNQAPKVINTALENGILHFVVNGVSEKDWHLVKEMSENHPCLIPSFGLHPWFIMDRSPDWLTRLKEFFDANPSAAVGEIGLDKGPLAKSIDFTDQVEVFSQQLQLAREIRRPASVHCVHAFGDLLDIMHSIGPFPEGVILHSYLGSAEMVPEFAKLGVYFSFSGWLMEMTETKAKKMVKAVPFDRILLETDAPDALPKSNDSESVFLVDGDEKKVLNHPANIHFVLSYVASLLEMPKEELADISYKNAVRLFSYEGSKLQKGNENLQDAVVAE